MPNLLPEQKLVLCEHILFKFFQCLATFSVFITSEISPICICGFQADKLVQNLIIFSKSTNLNK